jgi:hypothetical protein
LGLPTTGRKKELEQRLADEDEVVQGAAKPDRMKDVRK